MKRILFLSNLYPNPAEPHRSAFNRQQITALSSHFEIDVIAPVSWIQCLKSRIPKHEIANGIQVYHPIYYYTPKILRGFYGWFYYMSLRTMAERLLLGRGYLAIFASWLFPDGWAAARLANEFSLPLYLKVHGTDVNSLTPGEAVTRASLQAASQARKVLCVSDALQAQLLALGASKEKLITIRNGIDKTIFHPMDSTSMRNYLQIPVEERVILYVGNLKQEKGLGEVAEVMKILTRGCVGKNIRLVIIGSGPYQKEFESRLGASGISDRVSFLGSRSLTEIARWMNATDVLCLPSYMEGMPNVVLEALSCGTKVVATAVGGIPELETGDGMLSLVPPHDVHALVTALGKTLCSKTSRRNDLRTGVGRGVRILSWEENAIVIADLINERDVRIGTN